MGAAHDHSEGEDILKLRSRLQLSFHDCVSIFLRSRQFRFNVSMLPVLMRFIADYPGDLNDGHNGGFQLREER